MRRGYLLAIGVIALILGLVIVGRGVVEHASLLYDGVGLLFILLGGVRLYEASRGGRR